MKKNIFFVLILAYSSFANGQEEACLRASEGESLLDKTLYNSSGNVYIDNVTVQELNFMTTRFLVRPSFFFCEGDNAEASKEIALVNYPDGTVAFGSQLFNREYIRSPGGPSIPIIIAHEFGHIVQYKYGGFKNFSVMRKELFADYLAGAYLQIRGGLDWNAVLECFEEMGDTDFGSLDHHGTPEQRTSALKKGGNDVLIYGNNFTLSRAISLGKAYVKNIKDPNDDDTVDPEQN